MHFGFQSAFWFCCLLHFFIDTNVDVWHSDHVGWTDRKRVGLSGTQDLWSCWQTIKSIRGKTGNPQQQQDRQNFLLLILFRYFITYNKHNHNHNTHLSVKRDEWMDELTNIRSDSMATRTFFLLSLGVSFTTHYSILLFVKTFSLHFKVLAKNIIFCFPSILLATPFFVLAKASLLTIS